MALHVIGVRHHSPACARLVARTIRELTPAYVLIEGPSDMNGRLEELFLPHELPIALFTYEKLASGATRGTWSPFCAYSPEWVALQTAREVGAEPMFVDLPAWDPAFEGEENRYSDRHVRHGERVTALCAELGFEDSDALWDHLFEQPLGDDGLRAELDRYFEALRGDDEAGACDGPREAYMARYIAWAMAACEERGVVVVCGGYHKPALERSWRSAATARPNLPEPREGAVTGSYLVPHSFRRLDSFAGYASGMPSPRFYQTVWDKGRQDAGEWMMFEAIRHLRTKRQRVSPADAIAAASLAQGLKALRGHDTLARVDVLDGLAGALVKDALEAPLPWSRRGRLSPRTEPFLVELVAVFSGDAMGRLAPGTPAPPLLADVAAELARVGLSLAQPASVKVPLGSEHGREQSRVLHRLRVLGIPGVRALRGPSLSRTRTELSEEWSLARTVDTDTALIERALYGASLESAALGKLEQQTHDADIAALADALADAALCGIRGFTARGLAQLAEVARREASLGALGQALRRLVSLRRGEHVLGVVTERELEAVVSASFDRGLWLFEGLSGQSARLDRELLAAVVALRDVLGAGWVEPERPRTLALCQRRAHDALAPAWVRGAALGLLWCANEGDAAEGVEQGESVAVLRALSRPETCGDFLAGLFALARERVLGAEPLLRTVDAVVTGLLREDFLVALPTLRQAFAYFPPRERLTIAGAVLALCGAPHADPMQLVQGSVDAELVLRGAALERTVAELALRFGLDDARQGGGP